MKFEPVPQNETPKERENETLSADKKQESITQRTSARILKKVGSLAKNAIENGDFSERTVKNITRRWHIVEDAIDQGEIKNTIPVLARLANEKSPKMLREQALSALRNVLPVLEKNIEHKEFLPSSLAGITALIQNGTANEKIAGREIIKRNFERIKQDSRNSYYSFYYVIDALESYVDFADPLTQQSSLNLIEERLFSDLKSMNFYNSVIPRLLASECGTVKNITMRVLREKMNTYGLSLDACINAWIAGGGDRMSRETIITQNIETVVRLETQQPGITKVLHDEFGIYNFGRYPDSVLLKQYKEKDMDLDYGIALYPYSDHNGAFSANGDSIESLSDSLQKISYGLRIGEIRDKIDVLKFIRQLAKKYKHKISLAIIGGHGTRDSIDFGKAKQGRKGVFLLEDLTDSKHPISTYKKYFVPNPEFVLISCSTGAEKGIAEQLANELEAKVTAPEVPTNISSLGATKERNRVMLHVLYNDKNSAKTYAPTSPSQE